MSKNVVEIIASTLPPSARPAAKTMRSVLEIAILAGLRESGQVSVPGMGVFKAKVVPPRMVRNPRTGEKVLAPQKYRVVFRPSAAFLRRLGEEPAAGNEVAAAQVIEQIGRQAA